MIWDLLFPNRCLECNRIISGEDLVCEICMEQINFAHWKMSSDNPLRQRCSLIFPVENASALMFFEEQGLARDIVHALKYGGREKVGKILAQWSFARLEFETQPDLIVTIPLHPKKEKKRGYNQLHLFANELSRNFDIPVEHSILKRNFYKKAQALKDKSQRSEKENRFSIEKNIDNKHVLIIDDVYTTGNTMASAAWEILNAGNNKVSVFVMAMEL